MMRSVESDGRRPLSFFLHNTPRVGVLALLIPLIFSACAKKEQKPPAKPPVPVAVAAVERRTVPIQVKAIGNVEAYTTVAIKSQVSGAVQKVHFSEGQDVKKGDLLFTIDPRSYEADMRKAEANLARNLVQARNAKQDAERYAQLVKDGIVTQEQSEQYRTKAESFAADVAADRAAVENARVQLGYCYLRAPQSGRTGNLMVHAGNIVKANENPALVTINQISPIYVTFSIPEKELAEIKRLMAAGPLRVEAVLPNDPEAAESGRLSFIDNTVDTATGTIKLKGTFENKERRLWPGQFVTVTIILATRKDAAVVPSQAVMTGQQGAYVFVAKQDGTAELRPVTPGITSGGITLIEKGLQPGETVVTDGQMRLMPGAKIMVKMPDAKGKPSSPTPAQPVPGK